MQTIITPLTFDCLDESLRSTYKLLVSLSTSVTSQQVWKSKGKQTGVLGPLRKVNLGNGNEFSWISPWKLTKVAIPKRSDKCLEWNHGNGFILVIFILHGTIRHTNLPLTVSENQNSSVLYNMWDAHPVFKQLSQEHNKSTSSFCRWLVPSPHQSQEGYL